jgi:predicted nucleic acid-binding protein
VSGILDSSVLIAAKRQGKNARQALTAIRERIGETEVGISVVTLIELAHGAARADTPQRQRKRQKFIQEFAREVDLVSRRSACSTRLCLLLCGKPSAFRAKAYDLPFLLRLEGSAFQAGQP